MTISKGAGGIGSPIDEKKKLSEEEVKKITEEASVSEARSPEMKKPVSEEKDK